MVIVGISNRPGKARRLLSTRTAVRKQVENINAYLVAGPNIIVEKAMRPLTSVEVMDFGNKADDGGHLTLSASALEALALDEPIRQKFIKRFYGSKEFINGVTRFCIWIENDDLEAAKASPGLAKQIELVRAARLGSKDAYAQSLASRPHQFKSPRIAERSVIGLVLARKTDPSQSVSWTHIPSSGP